MKIYNNLKRRVLQKTYNYLSLFILIFALGFSSCSEEININSELNLESSMLSICIPDVASAAHYATTRTDDYAPTRAGVSASQSEAKIKNIWFFAFPTEGSKGEKLATNLYYFEDKTSETREDSEYIRYNIPNFKEGDYHIYVLANMTDYLPNDTFSSNIDETTVRNLALNFSDLSTSNILQPGNLPMACLNNEISGKGYSNGVFSFSADNNTITANLTFLCSKVRYTILFDKDDFSGSYETNNINFESSVTSSPYHTQTTILPIAEDAVSDIEKLSRNSLTFALRAVKYPDKNLESEKNYLKEDEPRNNQKDLDILEGNSSWENPNKKAWQMLAYIPENIQEEESNKTVLRFNNSVGDNKETFAFTLIPSYVDENNKGIKRGNVYDILTKLTNPNELDLYGDVQVKDWDTKNIYYSLKSPSELIVEKTEVSLTSDNPAVFWYKSNVSPEDIKFEYPEIKIGEALIPFYQANVLKDERGNYVLNENGNYQIELKINPQIPYTELFRNVEYSNINQYKYFEIKAGNLYKRINISSIEFVPYLRVHPKNVEINIGELISSGKDSEILEIGVETNISSEINLECEATDLITGQGVLSLTASTNVSNLSQNSMTIKDGIGYLKLNIKDLFKGDAYWKVPRTIIVKFSSTDGTNSEEDTLTITVKPYSTNYTIHFKPTKGDWTSPHIYVYQCLEYPESKNVNGYDIKGRTVGYEDGNENKVALEYAFTNNISFKGWTGYGGSVNPDESGIAYNAGMVIFSNSERFDPKKSNTEIYNYTADFNTAHALRQDRWVDCTLCKNYISYSDYNSVNGQQGKHLVAGVAMEKEYGENDGWYKYTLTGIANPGKTLIMFFDGHESTGGSEEKRYPNKTKSGTEEFALEPVGLPLFDFADHEGWLEYDGNKSNRAQNFTDEKPAELESELRNYRIYWEYSSTVSSSLHNIGIFIFNWNNDIVSNETDATGEIKSQGVTFKYYDFQASVNESTFSYRMIRNSDSDCGMDHNNIKADFENIGDLWIGHFKMGHDHSSSYINTLTPGLPPDVTLEENTNETTFWNGQIIKIEWYDEWGGVSVPYIYLWGEDYEPLWESRPERTGKNEYDNLNYYSFTIPTELAGKSEFKCKVTTSTGSPQSKEFTVKFSDLIPGAPYSIRLY